MPLLPNGPGLLQGSSSHWATALQESHSCSSQGSIASCSYSGRIRRRILLGLVIDEQRGGHGVTPIEWALKPGEHMPINQGEIQASHYPGQGSDRMDDQIHRVSSLEI